MKCLNKNKFNALYTFFKKNDYRGTYHLNYTQLSVKNNIIKRAVISDGKALLIVEDIAEFKNKLNDGIYYLTFINRKEEGLPEIEGFNYSVSYILLDEKTFKNKSYLYPDIKKILKENFPNPDIPIDSNKFFFSGFKYKKWYSKIAEIINYSDDIEFYRNNTLWIMKNSLNGSYLFIYIHTTNEENISEVIKSRTKISEIIYDICDEM